LLDRVETQLQEMGRAIFSGAARVDPYRKGHETPCTFCDYRAVCRIDPWTHRYRVLRPSAEKTYDNSGVSDADKAPLLPGTRLQLPRPLKYHDSSTSSLALSIC